MAEEDGGRGETKPKNIALAYREAELIRRESILVRKQLLMVRAQARAPKREVSL
jgi:hypothetical protein